MPSGEEPKFILGLTMAGAISAGAYSAGVFDFLIQALDEWEKAKKTDAGSVPNHRVVIPVISGASAGGITAALGIVAVGAERRPQTKDDAQPHCALPALYEAWVNRISFARMLEGEDLEEKGRLASLLDSTIIEEAAGELLLEAVHNFKEARPYLAQDLHLFLTVTNLRGVPYQIAFQAGGHVMTMHCDRIHYCLEGFGKSRVTSNWLNSYSDKGVQVTPQNLLNGEFRSQFQAAVLSTGAFPIGLPARLIERQTSDYQSRAWAFRVDKRRQLDTLRPKWPERADGRSEYPVLYAGSDGGLIDNEPFELAHWTIMKRAGTPNETSAKKADRAVLMIDPFPTPSSFDPDISDEKVKEQLWLRKVIFSLFPVLKDQARFKAIDLARAANAEVYSRFLIAPSRRINVKRNGRADRIEAYEPLATGVLNGFGGFLCRKFPDFDYQLGRRNCQQFLSERLVLDANNPLFKNWPANAKDRKRFCSIIPLLGSAIPEVELPQWPRVGEDLVEEFMAHVKRRVSKLVKKVSREEIGGGLGIVVRVGWWLYRGKVLGWIRSWLVADLIGAISTSAGNSCRMMWTG
jgi:hypothetical protein